MNPFIFYIVRSCFGILLLFTVQACKKFVDVKPAPDLIDTEIIFSSDATAIAAINSVYVQMRTSSPSLANGTLSIYSGLSGDELNTTSSNLEYDIFEQNSIPVTSSVISYQLWTTAYKTIYRTNIILENLQNSTKLSSDLKRQLSGEMKVVRALHYFYLINLFGDVPLIVSSDYRQNESKARTSVNEVYDQLVTDLTEASKELTDLYPGEGKLRPNKFTALALLARVYLYRNDWPKAEIISSEIINSGKYQLATLSDAFKKDGLETLWEIASPNDIRNTVEGSMFIPSSPGSTPVFYLSQSLLNAFETGDERKINWTGITTVTGNPFYFPFKYKNRVDLVIDEYLIVFRLAEQYLIRAEARAKQHNTSDAKEDLDKIRNRAGLSNSMAADENSLIEEILHERQVEFFSEWGHRWLDMKRTGKADALLSAIKGTEWQTTDGLYPVPFGEIQLNPFLSQNPGY